MEERNVIEWACEFKKYAQYEKLRQECEAGNEALEDVLYWVGFMNPKWIRRYNAKEQV